MDDVRGRFLGLPHGTTPAAVTTNNTRFPPFSLYVRCKFWVTFVRRCISDDKHPALEPEIEVAKT